MNGSPHDDPTSRQHGQDPPQNDRSTAPIPINRANPSRKTGRSGKVDRDGPDARFPSSGHLSGSIPTCRSPTADMPRKGVRVARRRRLLRIAGAQARPLHRGAGRIGRTRSPGAAPPPDLRQLAAHRRTRRPPTRRVAARRTRAPPLLAAVGRARRPADLVDRTGSGRAHRPRSEDARGPRGPVRSGSCRSAAATASAAPALGERLPRRGAPAARSGQPRIGPGEWVGGVVGQRRRSPRRSTTGPARSPPE